ncbi:MAG: (Fe-S)-binding protein [Thermodesulfobacteriota bacterium]|nr:(Fe-S)-binding protein [Thermodesulfobacteriota bacterium]
MIKPSEGTEKRDLNRQDNLDLFIKESGVYQCIDCGKCTGACPIAETGKEFSPRVAASKVIEKGDKDPYVQEFIWTCLTCGRCDERCPSGVKFSDFVRKLRELRIESGDSGVYSHGGAMFSIMKMMASPDLKQKRTDFLPSDVKIKSRGKTLYFMGCVPYFDVFFKDIGLNTVQIAIDALRVLNRCGIEPVVLDNERCCGHDLFWSGDQKGFVELAKTCYQEIRDHDVEEIITSCPECLYTLGEIFPTVVKGFDLKVTHISQVIEERIDLCSEKPQLNPVSAKISFKDSCRLNRYGEASKSIRRLLDRIPELESQDTPDSLIGNICCGNSSWVGCGWHSKTIQMKRLRQTIAAGSQVLVTSCPKCLIHLQCTKNNFSNDKELDIKDMISVLAEAMEE